MKCAVYGTHGHFGYIKEAKACDPSIEVVGVAGAEEDNVSALESAFPGAKRYDTLEELIEKTECDVLGVTPAFYRASAASIYAMEKGVDVFSDKPLALNEKDLNALIETWKKTGRDIDAMFGIAFDPWYLTMKKAVEEGYIGDVRLIHGQKSYKLGTRPDFFRERAKFGGLIPWVAIHALDWALEFGGLPESVMASHSTKDNAGYGDLEVSAAILTQFENGAAATVTADYFRPVGAARHDDDRLRLTGTKGMLEAMDGKVYYEGKESKRELPLLPAGNCFIDFLEKRANGEADALASRAFLSTRVALLAREAADEGKIIRMKREDLVIKR